jgi:DNA-binding transcriptional MerR regulator
MQIGELSRRTGVSVRMLRYYEREHLLQPARRSSGYRVYGEDDVRLVERIRALSAAGLTLATARIVLPCVNDRGQRFQPCKEVRPALEREMQRISEKIAALEKSRQILTDYLGEAG